MSLLVLGITAMISIFSSVVIMVIDTMKRRRGNKVKIGWMVCGILLLLYGLVTVVGVTNGVHGFDGEEVSNRKVIDKLNLDMKDVRLNRSEMTLYTVLAEDVEGFVQTVRGEKSKYNEIVYIDKLKNRKYLKVNNISEVEYSEQIGEDSVRVVTYLVVEKEKWYTLPQVKYLIVLNNKWK